MKILCCYNDALLTYSSLEFEYTMTWVDSRPFNGLRIKAIERLKGFGHWKTSKEFYCPWALAIGLAVY